MKIVFILPNWLGDAVMATPTIELMAQIYPDAQFVFIGSYVSIEALKYHPLCKQAIIDTTKQSKNRLFATYTLAKSIGKVDMAISFRNQIFSSLLLAFIDTKIAISRYSWHAKLLRLKAIKIDTNQHLVQQYTKLINKPSHLPIPNLTLHIPPKKLKKPTLGINAGATYGSAKRWYPERFAEVGAYFSDKFDIIIFGGPNEVQMAQDIEKYLQKNNISNYTNLAGKTNIYELCSTIGGCELFLTNDSGPMHIAAAYQVPTVAIFGPTKYKETSQWNNKKSKIVRHEMECSPCMKRECPLGHHECMTSISAFEVIEAIKDLL